MQPPRRDVSGPCIQPSRLDHRQAALRWVPPAHEDDATCVGGSIDVGRPSRPYSRARARARPRSVNAPPSSHSEQASGEEQTKDGSKPSGHRFQERKGMEEFVVKSGLRRLINEDALRRLNITLEDFVRKIGHDAFTVSNMMREAYYFMVYALHRDPNTFDRNPDQVPLLPEERPADNTAFREPTLREFFYGLQQTRQPTAASNASAEAYREFRALDLGSELYDSSYRAFLIQNQAALMTTNLKNNVVCFMESRLQMMLRTYLKINNPHDSAATINANARVAVKKLYYEEHVDDDVNAKCAQAIEQFSIFVRGFVNVPNIGTYFNKRRVASNWWKYIRILHEMQKHLFDQQQKSFCVLPRPDFNLKHVLYTKDAFYQLLRSLGANVTREQAVELLPQIMKVSRLKKEHKGKFTGTFSTNGIDASVHFFRKKRKPKTVEERLDSVAANLGDYSTIVGIDPGKKVFYGAVKTDLQGERREIYKMKNHQWQHYCGDSGRRFEEFHWKNKNRIFRRYNNDSLLNICA